MTDAEMAATDKFIELVDVICRRPAMFGYETYNEICAYLCGYARGSSDGPLSRRDGWEAFQTFICATFRFPQKHGWPSVLRWASRDDHEAIARMRELLIDFATRSKTQTFAEIARDAMSKANEHEEGEPEKTWRKFFPAMMGGHKEAIEALIQPHPRADILWSGDGYSDEAALMLSEIDESYFVSQIAGSEAEGEVTIITPDFGPISLKPIDGSWKIDASGIIECQLVNAR